MLEGHISKAFDGDLAALHLRVLAMGGLVLDQVREAAHAYGGWDDEAAEHVMQRCASVGAYDAGISEEQFALIARRQPVASDLRAVISFARIRDELERAGGECAKIAQVVLRQGGRPARSAATDARHLAELAVSLMRAALEALDGLSESGATQVVARDRELDAEYAAGLRRLLTHAMEDPRHFDVALEAAFVLKSFERIGDHARAIAEHVLAMLPRPQREPMPLDAATPAAPSASAGPG